MLESLEAGAGEHRQKSSDPGEFYNDRAVPQKSQQCMGPCGGSCRGRCGVMRHITLAK